MTIFSLIQLVSPLCRNMFLVCPMKNAPVLVIKNSSNGDYNHITLPTDGEVGKYILIPGQGHSGLTLKNWEWPGNDVHVHVKAHCCSRLV
jgi:thiamine pyrophosphokinase